jgi:hypothetical protein
MGLIHPSGPSWAYCTHNLPADIDATALGASCTSGTSNADGSPVALFASALSHDVEYLRLSLNGTIPSSGNNDVLMTVLIDPAGGTSWATLIPYLIVGAMGDVTLTGSTPAGPSGGYDFPIWIPAGASLGVMARSAHTSAAVLKVTAFAFGGNRNPASWWAGQRVTAIGVTAAASTGTAHTAGASAVFSSWANLGSALTADCGALQFGVNGPGVAAYSGNNYQFEFGVGGVRIGPPLFRILTSQEAGWCVPTGPIFEKLTAGTQLQVRAACNGASPQALGVAAWAVH